MPAQGSFRHNDNADRHYGPSVPRFTLDTHRSDTDLTNRPQTLRQEPLPAKGPLPYSDREDRHYGYRAVQTPSNTRRSDSDFSNKPQTLRKNREPAQSSFIHNDNADRHYDHSSTRVLLNIHRSGTDLTNRPQTLRQEPLPAQGHLPYSDSEDRHYGYRALQTPSNNRRSDTDLINRPQTLRQEPLPAQVPLPYSDSEDRHYGYRVQQNPSNTRRSETDFTNRPQTVREEFVPAQGSFLHNDNADRHCGPGILRFPLGTHQSYTDLTIKPQTHEEKTMPGQGPFRHHESADQHLGSDITEHLPDSMIVGEPNTCTRPVRPEYVSDENDLIHDRSIGEHSGSVLAGNNSDTELLRRRAGKGYQYSTGDHSLCERSSERHCEYDFGKGDQLLSRAGKPRHCSYEVGKNKISIPRPSVNPLIHGDKEKRLNSRKCPEDMEEIETVRENPQSSTKWLGLPITTQPNSVTRQSGAHEKPVKMPAFNGTDSWKVWYNRFKTIANLNEWDETTKLNELLPRLQGEAGEFVYGELPQEIIGNFSKLIEELKSRFRTVETHKTYEAQFSKRSQLYGETVEEYCAALKRLYDKAHANRNPESRREALLRRFLNGLLDDQARFEVEYHKDPSNIDEAVCQVVSYMEAKKVPHV